MNALLDEVDRSEAARRPELTHEQKEGLRKRPRAAPHVLRKEFDRDGAHGFAVFCAWLDNVWRPTAVERARARPGEGGEEPVPLAARAARGSRRGGARRGRQPRARRCVPPERGPPGGSRRALPGAARAARPGRLVAVALPARTSRSSSHDHLKDVAETLDRQVRGLGGPPLVIVAADETRGELEEMLSHDVQEGRRGLDERRRPRGAVRAARGRSSRCSSRGASDQESEVVERWKEEAGRNGRAAAGWASTLEAASDGRVELLLFEDGADRPAWECPACGRVAAEGGACPLDGTQTEERGRRARPRRAPDACARRNRLGAAPASEISSPSRESARSCASERTSRAAASGILGLMASLARTILEDHLERGELVPGQEIALRVDQTLAQDATGTMAMMQFESFGVERVQVETAVVYVDHNILQIDFKNPDDHRFLQAMSARYGAWFSRPGNGICHYVHCERFAAPGKTLVGADSHTTQSGSCAMIAIGAGGLDVAVCMAGHPFELPCPKIVGVFLENELKRPWIQAKDVILELLRRRGGARRPRRDLRVHRPRGGGPELYRARHDREHDRRARRDGRGLPGRRRDARLDERAERGRTSSTSCRPARPATSTRRSTSTSPSSSRWWRSPPRPATSSRSTNWWEPS